MKLKNNKGITGVDIAISTTIIIVFISFISALFYNVGTTSKKIERKTVATDFAINIIEAMKTSSFTNLEPTENAEKENFVDLTQEQINSLISKNIPDGYKISIYIEDYNNENIIKIIKVKVTYKIGKNTEDVTIETLVKNQVE